MKRQQITLRLGAAGFLLATTLPVRAVILADGDGTQNTTAPTGDQGWSYVGRISNKPSGVTYISNNWFITAYHIKYLDNPTAVILDGTTYTIDAASWTRITNSTGTDADLILFRVNESVPLTGLSLVSATPKRNTSLTMIGNGMDRETTNTYWDANWNEVDPTSPLAVYTGYKWLTTTSKRWGVNTLEGTAAAVNDGYGTTDMIYTDFDNATDEAQGATYDSGGGVFVDDGTGNWELAGIMLTVSGYTGQPSQTSVYGNRTYSADISVYADQIQSVVAVPEPTVAVALCVTALGFIFIHRRFAI